MKYHQTILDRRLKKRVPFDPMNKEHLAEFKFFRENARWKTTCPFLLEEPYLSIPSMCEDRCLNLILA